MSLFSGREVQVIYIFSGIGKEKKICAVDGLMFYERAVRLHRSDGCGQLDQIYYCR